MVLQVYIEDPTAQAHFDAIRVDILQWLAQAVARDARRYAPVDTGYLKTHINPHYDLELTPFRARVVAEGAGMPPDEDVPAYVEFGTRPHDIPNAFGMGFTAHHPGTDPQPFLRPAAYTKRRVPEWVVRGRASGPGWARGPIP